jgi:hypothetical protein
MPAASAVVTQPVFGLQQGYQWVALEPHAGSEVISFGPR